MRQTGSGGGGFVLNLGTFVVIAVVVAGLVALGLWIVFSA
jgi:hypothetical protein